MEILEFTFHSFWRFWGMVIILGLLTAPLIALANAIGRPKK